MRRARRSQLTRKARILRETEEIVLSRKRNSGAARQEFMDRAVPLLLRKFLAGARHSSQENDRFINQVHRDDIAAALISSGGTAI